MKTKILSIAIIAALLTGCDKKDDDNNKPSGKTPINSYTNINLGNDKNDDYGSFINLKSGQVYFLSKAPKALESQSNIDLVYWYNNINHGDPYLGAPAEVKSNIYEGEIFDNNPDGINFWTTVNNTFFSSTNISVGEFNNITSYEQLKDAVDEIYGHYEYNVKSEKVYKFKTWDNKIGLLKINTIVGRGDITATMNIDIKVQK